MESLKLPLHEAVRLELTENEPPSLTPFFDKLFMLANLCLDMEDGVVGDWNESFGEAVEVFRSSFTGPSTGCSTGDIGAGTKNF